MSLTDISASIAQSIPQDINRNAPKTDVLTAKTSITLYVYINLGIHLTYLG